ncbi:2-phospho-L-lactate guanylyltransferase [Cellulomonas sp.]|uniref:2-phospho-L-lactate guanylyltransferase n=1 Tax=Cellulomonas sp. TaxID=40001 RepID=UPI001B196593|nr:2-phospho-L-lactate guanylyltransferase [Cellulomonas sp.]MBO9553698.1 2-phospho-L-lactate guanylyltransferase [Cellulomonas sp.]
MPTSRWVVVVPVKTAAAGKTRLAGVLPESHRQALVRAMALDTVAAAVATPGVVRVLVVTADEPVRRGLPEGAEAVDEPLAAAVRQGAVEPGLDAAVLAGAARAAEIEPVAGVAVLLGDLPALRPRDLAAALDRAAGHGRALVADAQGTGTTLLTATPGVEVRPRFGAGSAAAHEAAGHVRLDVPQSSSLRRDVDVPVDLLHAAHDSGPRTRAVLGTTDA